MWLFEATTHRFEALVALGKELEQRDTFRCYKRTFSQLLFHLFSLPLLTLQRRSRRVELFERRQNGRRQRRFDLNVQFQFKNIIEVR